MFTVINDSDGEQEYIFVHVDHVNLDEHVHMEVSRQNVPSSYWEGISADQIETILEDLRANEGLLHVSDPFRFLTDARLYRVNQ